ncbi:MAG: ATP-binding cassette domain-containing protein [Nitrospirales bacterium]|nr:ATP-binding cassette domain-containing protein [Nitrospirales bacterium]
MIEVQHVTKQYGPITAVRDISFSVKEGEIVAFLGPNGAGKTTTMRLLTGYMPPTEGTLRIAGYDCAESPIQVKHRIGYLPESPPLYLELTVHEFLTFVGRLKGLSSEQLTQRKGQVLEQTGLGDVQHRVIGHLSRGYRQRVGLAQAILHDPPVLILDEPSVGLDPNQIIEIRDLIKSLAGTHTIILSTHILSEATALCQRVIIIHQGRIAAVDTPEQLSARLRQTQKLSLTVKKSLQDMEHQLRAILGVQEVCAGPSSNTYIIEASLDSDIQEDLTQFVVKHGLGLLELKSQSLTLEDVFIRLTHDTPSNKTEEV